MAFSLAGSGEHATRCISRLTWLLPPPPGGQQRPFIRSITHAPGQAGSQPQQRHCSIDLAAPHVPHCALALTDFHEVSRAVGPNWQGRKPMELLAGLSVSTKAVERTAEAIVGILKLAN